MFDPIQQPDHYTSGDIECIEFIDAQGWLIPFALGNVVKYATRAMRKGTPVEDLKKAQRYLDFAIAKLEHGRPKPESVLVRRRVHPYPDHQPLAAREEWMGGTGEHPDDGRFSFKSRTDDIDPGGP